MSSFITIKGADGVHKMLNQYMQPILPRRLQRAMKAGGDQLKNPLKAESRKVSRRMGNAVTVVQSPSGLAGKLEKVRDPHVFVGYRRKTAPFAHMVIGGTRAHGPRKARVMVFRNPPVGVVATHVSGVQPNPIVSRVAAAHGDKAYSAIWRDLDKTEK